MKKTPSLLFVLLVLVSGFAQADWNRLDEIVCHLRDAGHFKYYVLSLTWSPEFCRSHPAADGEQQCRAKRGFVVHGLWPECGSGGPSACDNGGAADPIDKSKIYAFMPSDYLIQHEWEKHGTCSGLDRSAYFNLIGEQFGKLKLPRLSGAPNPAKIKNLFLAQNPGLNADQIYLSCREGGPKSSTQTLDEVRICLDKKTYGYVRCEDARDSCQNLNKVIITPAN
jgi:ribonuclease T2